MGIKAICTVMFQLRCGGCVLYVEPVYRFNYHAALAYGIDHESGAAFLGLVVVQVALD